MRAQPGTPPRLCDNDGRIGGQDGDRPNEAGAIRRREMASMHGRVIRSGIAAGLLLLSAAAWADGPTPAAPPPGVPASAERFFQQGLDAQKKKDWRNASQAYQAAIKERDAFPEAWNGLGYSLRQQGKYDEAVKAYDRALKLRPDYAEALEYLGEAYVMMGRPDDARRVLDRLKPLDAGRAKELAEVIDKGR